MSLNHLGHSVTTAASVANEFLLLGEEERIPIDQMKLQKLLFYAHAWYLGYNNAPLFEEDFEAWPWGPVVRDIYAQTIKYRRSPITNKIVEINSIGGRVDFYAPNGVECPIVKTFIKAVWDIHKAYTGIQLSNSTHAVGEPWTIIKEIYRTLENKPTIPNSLIASIYKSKAESENKAS